MDPKTATFTEWPLPPVTHHEFAGGSDVQVDREDNIWFPATNDKANNHFGEYTGEKIGMFDTRTEKFQEWPAPFKWAMANTRNARLIKVEPLD